MSVELIELQDSARRVMENIGLAAEEGALWTQIIELGWLWVSVPESMGGLGAGIQGAITMHVELGRGLSTVPYLPSMLAVAAICQSTLENREAWLERLTGGELVTASLADCHIRSDGKCLNGTAVGVQSADSASHILIWTADGETVSLVALGQPGIELISRPTWDKTRRLFDVHFTEVELASQTLLAKGAVAEKLIQRLLIQRNFALAAEAIGGAGVLLSRTVEHLQTRIQFRRPLAVFQALKHRCADMKTSIAAAEAMLFDALRNVEGNFYCRNSITKAMGAKLLASSTFAQVAEDCLQLHGGIGMANEHSCHLFLKRSLLDEQLGGHGSVYTSEIASHFLSSVI